MGSLRLGIVSGARAHGLRRPEQLRALGRRAQSRRQLAKPMLVKPALLEPALFRDIVNRIPHPSRFPTATVPPNSASILQATGGPMPRSPPGVDASPIEKRSKNLGI